jgi:hypothetical protein
MLDRVRPKVIYLKCLLLAGFVAMCSAVSCNQATKPALTDDVTEGKQLSIKYCSSCHKYPEPDLLDKNHWETGVLPAMAKKYGIGNFMGQYMADSSTSISLNDWQKIVKFYTKLAPAKLEIPKDSSHTDWAIFSLKRPRPENKKGQMAMTTMLTFDEETRSLYSADAANNLYKWTHELNKRLIDTLPSAVTGAVFTNYSHGHTQAVVSCIGVLPPNNLYKGQVVQLEIINDKVARKVILADSLPRSVQITSNDFNKDGLTDYVVCGYGNDVGGLYLLTQTPGHKFSKSIIRRLPGSEQVITGDFNNDGWPDIMCLFAQADEGIWLFLNDHRGGFTSQNLLRFPPIYGSTSFQLVDFNHDGKLDILYTCGDNADYSQVLKPYHGLYIFINEGNWRFKQTYFYHIDGCTKAIAADFDHDGDLDIASIAYFPDFKNNPAGFTYLEQSGALHFTAHQLPINKYGRWLTMQAVDLYNTGNLDIVLGNFSNTSQGLATLTGVKQNWDVYEPLIVLKNNAPKTRAK